MCYGKWHLLSFFISSWSLASFQFHWDDEHKGNKALIRGILSLIRLAQWCKRISQCPSYRAYYWLLYHSRAIKLSADLRNCGPLTSFSCEALTIFPSVSTHSTSANCCQRGCGWRKDQLMNKSVITWVTLTHLKVIQVAKQLPLSCFCFRI